MEKLGSYFKKSPTAPESPKEEPKVTRKPEIYGSDQNIVSIKIQGQDWDQNLDGSNDAQLLNEYFRAEQEMSGGVKKAEKKPKITSNDFIYKLSNN